MKNTIAILRIIALVAVIMFSMTSCNKSANTSAASSTSSASSTEMAASGGSSPLSLSTMDRFLIDYETFLNDYIKVLDKMGPLYKRLIVGDMTACAEIEELQPMLDNFKKKYEDFGNRYEEYTPSAFTPSQLKKWEQITTKYADAISDVFGQ